MSQASKLAIVKEMIEAAETSLHSAKQILNELTGGSSKNVFNKITADLKSPQKEDEKTIVEGVFNGESMNDKSGKEYPVPANYASKSKLIPGDVLKLTIGEDGGFTYKQIGPIGRKRIVGTLTYEDGQYKVIAEGKAYKVLLASVTYFKGEIGNKVTLVVPEVADSEWGAIENILPLEAEDINME